MELSGKIAFVTGGGKGIGRAIALALAEAGAHVAIAGRNEQTLTATLAELGPGATAHALDVTDRGQIRRVVDDVAAHHGRIDILINNAGVSGITPLDGGAAGAESAAEMWDTIVATNLGGLYHVTRAVVPHMPDGGRIVNLSSVLGRFGVPGYAAYCATKAGVIGFTRAAALELAARQITVNALVPGWVETDMATTGIRFGASATGQSEAEFRQQAEAAVPLGAFLDPTEIGALARYVVSPAARNLTGQALALDGGATMV